MLQTNVLYIGTAKMAAGVLEGRVHIEPSCCILIALSSANALELPEQIATSRAASAQIYASLASIYNQVSRYLNVTFRQGNPPALRDDRSFQDFWQSLMDQQLNTKEGTREALRSLYPGLQPFIRLCTIHFDGP